MAPNQMGVRVKGTSWQVKRLLATGPAATTIGADMYQGWMQPCNTKTQSDIHYAHAELARTYRDSL